MCVSSNPNIIITDQPIHQYEWTNKVCTPRRVRHILSASTPTTTTTTTTLRMGTKDTNEEIKTNSDTLGAAAGSAASKPRKDPVPCRSYASRFHLPPYGGVSQKKNHKRIDIRVGETKDAGQRSFCVTCASSVVVGEENWEDGKIIPHKR